eukprot:gene44618-67306_t
MAAGPSSWDRYAEPPPHGWPPPPGAMGVEKEPPFGPPDAH